MKENFKMLKDWSKMCKPNKLWFTFEFVFVLIYRLSLIITPIFASKVITCLTVADFEGAIFNLFIGFVIVFGGIISQHFSYQFYYPKLLGPMYVRLQSSFVANLLRAKKDYFDLNSKEKLLNIFQNDTISTLDYCKTLTSNIAFIFQAIITLIIVFVWNVWIGLLLVAVLFLNSFVLNWLYKNYSRSVNKRRFLVDKKFRQFSEVYDSSEIIKEIGVEKKIKKDFNKSSKDFVKHSTKMDLWASGIDNWFYVFYSFGILLITIILVLIVGSGNLGLEKYLILVAYVASCVDLSNKFFAAMSKIKKISVYQKRVEVLLSASPKELKNYASEDNENIVGVVDFVNVKYTKNDEKTSSLMIDNIRIRDNSITLIKGNAGSGKRTIFNLLRRQISKDSGRIVIDGIDIENYTEESYQKNVSFVAPKAFFFEGSIEKNLTMVNSNKAKINAVLKSLGILKDIEKLGKGLKTNIKDVEIKPFLKYMIGFARTLLLDTEILMIYEIPVSFSKEEKQRILKILSNIKHNRTIIVFSANEDYIEVCDKLVHIENGKVSNIQFLK